jgi:hypothetical protein
MLIEDATPSYRSVPVVEDSSEPRKVYNVRVPRPALGEEWHVCTEVHVTNDDLRERGAGVAAVTEVRFSHNSGNGRKMASPGCARMAAGTSASRHTMR